MILAVLIVGCSTTNQDDKLETKSFETNEETSTSFQDTVEDTKDTMNDSMDKEMNMEDSIKTMNSYRDFTLEDYNQALNSGDYVVLDFHSDWCPKCNTEDAILSENFNNLKNIVVFRVSYGDSQTSEDEEAIADQFDVSNRATGIVLKDGVEISRYGGHKDQLEYQELFSSLI